MNNNEVIGFFTVTTKKQTKEMEGKIPSWNKNDPELISCVNFYMYEATNEDFILHYIAIDSIYRGCGFFKRLNSYLVELARKNYCKRIVFVVRQSNPAFQIYKYYGARILGEITNIDTGLNEKLIKSYFTI
jgi:ribosomal protein S18 acetylase RimI-like enzyme